MEYRRACINCRRYHQGQCYNQPRTCWTCGESGHIQRFCSERRCKAPQRELLPGTGSWCHALGLDDDPLLKSDIKSTLKVYPGATIYLNDECVYRGVQTYFYRRALPQGPDLAERLTRSPHVDTFRGRRSRSPSRERPLKRSRSPLGRYNRRNSPEIVEDGEYEERSLTPHINSYTGRSFSPLIDLTDVDMDSPPHPSQKENIPPVRASLPIADRLSTNIIPRGTPSRFLAASRPALTPRSRNIPIPSLLDTPFNEKAVPQTILSGASVQIEDPYFVLGISKGAQEAEIISGFQQRMWEIDLEQSSEGYAGLGDWAAVNRWEESIRILTAAKAQLLRSG